ncbi:MAG: methyltransferase domain-containing protein [Methylocella sp.]
MITENAAWTFSGIADDFEGHIAKSVPLYKEGHELVCKYSDFFLNNGGKIFEIGCSTGTLTRRLLEWHKSRSNIQITGIDPVPDMIEFAKKKTENDPRISYICDDAFAVDMGDADIIISYYVMQFIAPKVRQNIFDKVYKSLNWGGAFFLFEKVRAPDARFQDYAAQVYSDFKLDQGFSEENIVCKTRSLKGNLEPFSTSANIDFMKRAGFSDMMTISKWVCFEGFLAIK